MRQDIVVIGISGKRGSGKDTLAAQMAPYGWKRVSFAEALKARCRADFGLTEEQTDGPLKESPTQYKRTSGDPLTPRDIMERCGIYYRSIDPNYFVKKAFQCIDEMSRDGFDPCRTIPRHTKFVITDVRFKNEANFIREQGGILVRLERKPELNIYKGVLDSPSETELDDYKFDFKVPADANVTIKDLVSEAAMLDHIYGGGAYYV